MRKKVFYLLALIGLTLACWLVAFLFWGRTGPGDMAVLTILCWLFTSTLLLAARRLSVRIRIFAGLLILALMFIPANIVVRVFPRSLEFTPFGSNMALTLFLIHSLALIISAFLLYSGLTYYGERGRSEVVEHGDSHPAQANTGRESAVGLLLCALIVAKAFQYLNWLMVWDSTYDGLGYIWLFIPALAVLFAGIMLIFTLPAVMKPVGFLYLLLIPALFVVTAYTQRISFRQLTERRAEGVSQAIEAYHTSKGRYPQNLGQLAPWHLRWLPEPVIIFGEDWCYDGGEDFYRLGYVDREHWSAPNIIGQIFETGGDVPDLQPMCADEAAVLMKRYPNSFWTFGE